MFAEKEGTIAMGMILHCGEDKTLGPDRLIPSHRDLGVRFLRVDDFVGDHDVKKTTSGFVRFYKERKNRYPCYI